MLNRGFTLIETLVYIALLGILMGGAMLAVYQLIANVGQVNANIAIEEEANFLLRKVNWALGNGYDTSDFDLDGDNLEFNGTILNSADVVVSDFDSSDPTKITFKLNGRLFETTKPSWP